MQVSDEYEATVLDSAINTGVTADPYESDLTACEFVVEHFHDHLYKLDDHARVDPFADELSEGAIILWQDQSDDWWVTDVYTQGDDDTTNANILRLNRPAESKNQITIHTHPVLSPQLSPADVLQLVPYTDDSQNVVGPQHALIAISLNFGSVNINAVERTEHGRAMNDLSTVQDHVGEIERIFSTVEEGSTPEFVRNRILEYYGGAVRESTLEIQSLNPEET